MESSKVKVLAKELMRGSSLLKVAATLQVQRFWRDVQAARPRHRTKGNVRAPEGGKIF